MRLTWLADVLRAAGLKVIELDGWKDRGSASYSANGVVCHHTATGPHVPDDAVDALLVKGRPDLKGPLAQCGIRRDGTWVVVASGRANHNGYGQWGNDSFGVEAYNDGIGEPWPARQLESYVRGVRAVCKHLGLDPQTHVKGHKETDPGRKIDPLFDMNEFRTAVAGAEEDDMYSDTDRARDQWTHDRVQHIERFLADPSGSIPPTWNQGARAILNTQSLAMTIAAQQVTDGDLDALAETIAGAIVVELPDVSEQVIVDGVKRALREGTS